MALKRQYHAALVMLREAVELCPEELWLDETPHNAFWRVAYHTLFYTHLYLLDRPEDFVPWAGHQAEVQHPDGMLEEADPKSDLPPSPTPYNRAQVLAYWELCDTMVDERIDAMDLDSAESGFYWYAMPKLEHQLVNLRHTQHHAAQLADRLRNTCGLGVSWSSNPRIA